MTAKNSILGVIDNKMYYKDAIQFGDLELGAIYDVFCVYPNGCYIFKGHRKLTYLTFEEIVYEFNETYKRYHLKFDDEIIWPVKILPYNYKLRICEKLKNSYPVELVNKILDRLYSGESLDVIEDVNHDTSWLNEIEDDTVENYCPHCGRNL